ncbi:membrane protein, partial [Priestia megaterium]
MEKEDKVVERILWSIALPGFGQILNGKLLKGILFIALEFMINLNSHFNEIIRLSFIGEIED